MMRTISFISILFVIPSILCLGVPENDDTISYGYDFGSPSDSDDTPRRYPDDDPRRGPGGSTLADIYCAYCLRYGLIECIRRWCYGYRIIAGLTGISAADLFLAAQNLGLTNVIIK